MTEVKKDINMKLLIEIDLSDDELGDQTEMFEKIVEFNEELNERWIVRKFDLINLPKKISLNLAAER